MILVYQGVVSDPSWQRPFASTPLDPVEDIDEAKKLLWDKVHEAAYAPDRVRLPIYVSGALYVGYRVDTPEGVTFEQGEESAVWHVNYECGRFCWVPGVGKSANLA